MIDRHAREFTVYTLRNHKLTFSAIGKRLGCSVTRVRQMHRRFLRRISYEKHWTNGLSARAANCLCIFNFSSRAEVLASLISADGLHPARDRYRNYGWKTHKEVATWLGLPEPVPGKCAKLKLAQAQFWIMRLLNDLPTSRDWLDPEIEVGLKAVVSPN